MQRTGTGQTLPGMLDIHWPVRRLQIAAPMRARPLSTRETDRPARGRYPGETLLHHHRRPSLVISVSLAPSGPSDRRAQNSLPVLGTAGLPSRSQAFTASALSHASTPCAASLLVLPPPHLVRIREWGAWPGPIPSTMIEGPALMLGHDCLFPTN